MGKPESHTEALLRLLEARFGPGATPDLAAKIRATQDLALLRRWFDAAVTVPSLAEFQQVVEGHG